MSEKVRFDTETALRGGIPICWPWFGAGRDGVSSPLHGFARLAEWRLVDTVESADQVKASYLLVDARPDKFAHPYRLTYEVSFGRDFSAALTVRNTGSSRFSFEAALHTYLKVGDVRQVRLTGLDGADYLDRVAGHEVGPHTQQGDVTVTGETDRIYQSTNDITVVDPTLNRSITVSRMNSNDAVVWNPWIDKARTMSDFGDDEWPGMICVETANVAEHAVTLLPGKEHTMGFTLTLGSVA
jgi:glucose-6-phosphate 1-epimerase